MQRLRIETLALATLLAGLSLASGQQPATPETAKQKQPPPMSKGPAADPKAAAPTNLEQLLQQALRDNPDIRVGEAKVRSAEAELHRTRLAVIQKVVAAHNAVTTAQANVALAEAQYARMQQLHKGGQVSVDEFQAAQARLVAAKAELAIAEGQLPYLTGQPVAQGVRFWDSATGREQDRRHALAQFYERMADDSRTALFFEGKQGPKADKLRAALEKPFTYEGNASIFRVVKAIKEKHPDLVIQLKTADANLVNTDETVMFNNVPLGAVLQWCEDAVPGHRFVIREYGLLLAPVKDMPPGAIYLTEFWKAGLDEKSKEKGEKP